MGYLSACFKLTFKQKESEKKLNKQKSVELTGHIKMFGGVIPFFIYLFFKGMF